MLSVYLLFLFCLSTNIWRAVSLPTKAEICANPKIDGGLALSDPNNDTIIIKRYLFYGPYMLPYRRDEHSLDESSHYIEWQNISLINETFKVGATKTPVQFAFEYRNSSSNEIQVYIRFTGDLEFNVFERKDSGFTLKKKVDSGQLQNQAFILFVSTFDPSVSDHSQQSSKSMFFFIDSTSEPMERIVPKRTVINYTYGKIAGVVFSCNKAVKNCENKIILDKLLFPNSIIFYNNRGNRLIIPTVFDGYYQTKYSETIFFRGEAACVTYHKNSIPDPNILYCQRFVDTSTIIGCPSFETNSLGREVDPDEPDHIEQDF